jgi:hypothetical protein
MEPLSHRGVQARQNLHCLRHCSREHPNQHCVIPFILTLLAGIALGTALSAWGVERGWWNYHPDQEDDHDKRPGALR